jgi:hypothetical protein
VKRVLIIVAVALFLAVLMVLTQGTTAEDTLWTSTAVIIVVAFVVIVGILIIRLVRHRREHGKLPEIVFETSGNESTKHDKTIEKWLKEHDEKELQTFHRLMTDEQLKDHFLSSAFIWTVSECKELSSLPMTMSTAGSDEADAQIRCINKYRKSGICVRCKNPLSGVIKEFSKKPKGEFYFADYLFISLHEYSGLCINCIKEFLLDFTRRFGSDSKEN